MHVSKNRFRGNHWTMNAASSKIHYSRKTTVFIFFPTSLCGVLVFGSVSCPLLLRRPRSHTLTHNFVTHTHNLSSTTWSQTTLSPTIFLTHTQTTLSPTTLFRVAGVAPIALARSGVTPRHFAWQAWHLATSTLCLRGRRGTWGQRRSLCVAGVALGDIKLCFAWHLWHCAFALICQTQLFHIQLLKLSILNHLLCLSSLPRPASASTSVSDYWKKLTCGVLQSFNFPIFIQFLIPKTYSREDHQGAFPREGCLV